MSKILIVILLLAPALAGAVCDEGDLVDKKSGVKLKQIMDQYLLISVRERDFVPTNAQLKVLQSEGWAEITRIAEENEISQAELLDQYFQNFKFWAELTAENDDFLKSNLKAIMMHGPRTQAAALVLGKLKPNDKLKFKHWDALKELWLTLHKMMGFIIINEGLHNSVDEYASVNPFAPFDRKQIRNLFDAMEEMTGDRLLDYTIATAESIENAHSQWATKPEEYAPKVEKPAVTPAPVPVAPDLISNTTPATTVASPITLDANTDLLSQVIKHDFSLSENKVYQAQTIRGQNLTIRIDKSIVQDDKGSEHQAVRRLLRGIMMGRGDTSGIKFLSDIGRHIIELKAMMHGHKRIIGCLDGSTLTLKYLIDIKDSRASYARRINPNLCL